MTNNGTKPMNGKPLDDLPPVNPEAERALLASLIALPEAMANPGVVAVRPGDFFDPAHRTIYRHLTGAWLQGQSPEVLPARITAANEMTDDVRAAVITLLKTGVSGSDAATYAGHIREASERRMLWQLSRELAEQVRSGLPVEDIRGFVTMMMEPDRLQTSKLEFITSAELADTDEEVPYIVPGMLAEFQPAVIGGPSKAMKTSVFVDLMVSIQLGGHYCGYFPVTTSRRCYLVSGESGRNVIKETARRICDAAGKSLRELGMGWGFKLPKLANAADIRELSRIIKGEGIEVVGIDPLYLSLDTDGKESSMFGMGPLLRPIAEMCADHKCTPIVAHHFRQTIRDFGPPSLQDLSHAGIEQFARQWILVKRREAYQAGTGQHRLHLVTGGSAGHGGSYHLDIDEGTRATPGGRFWDVNVTPANQAIANEQEQRAAAAAQREDMRRHEHKQKVLATLKQFPNGETRRALRQSVGMNDATFTDTIGQLIEAGDVELCEVKKHTSTHDGYRLKTHQKELCRDMVGHAEKVSPCL